MRRTGRRLVLDASTVVEFLGEFAHPAAARGLLEFAASDPELELWAPDLVYPEAASALRNLAARGAFAADEASVALRRILDLPLNAAGTAPLLAEAWSLREILTIYDACYAVLTVRLGGTFITADRPLVRALRDTDVHVVHLADVT